MAPKKISNDGDRNLQFDDYLALSSFLRYDGDTWTRVDGSLIRTEDDQFDLVDGEGVVVATFFRSEDNGTWVAYDGRGVAMRVTTDEEVDQAFDDEDD